MKQNNVNGCFLFAKAAKPESHCIFTGGMLCVERFQYFRCPVCRMNLGNFSKMNQLLQKHEVYMRMTFEERIEFAVSLERDFIIFLSKMT